MPPFKGFAVQYPSKTQFSFVCWQVFWCVFEVRRRCSCSRVRSRDPTTCSVIVCASVSCPYTPGVSSIVCCIREQRRSINNRQELWKLHEKQHGWKWIYNEIRTRRRVENRVSGQKERRRKKNRVWEELNSNNPVGYPESFASLVITINTRSRPSLFRIFGN